MNIVLLAVNSKYIHSNLAVYSLGVYAKKAGYETALLEGTVNQQSEEILREIYEAAPDVLAVSVYIWNVSFVEALLEDVRAVLPQVRIWLGGPEATWRAEELLKAHRCVDGVILGEGEQTFAELCRFWNDPSEKKTPAKIAGILWQDEDGIHSTGKRLPLDPDNLPFPYSGMELPEHRIFYYESSRGCPFGCTYCLSSVEKGVRFRDLRLVKRELQFFLDRKAVQVKFTDRTFNCDKKRSLEIWRYIKENDNGITNFHFETGAELLDDEEIALLAAMRPGQVQLECGVQTLNPEALKAIHRSMDFVRLSENIRKLQKNRNIHLHLDLIAGLPYEDLGSFRASFNGVYALRPNQLQLGFLKVLSGSPMASDADGFGCVWRKTPPYEVLCTKWLSYADVIRLKRMESVFEVYYNSRQFCRTMEQLSALFEDGFALYDSLAAFYQQKGYSEVSQSRIRRYEILREWIADLGRDPDSFAESMILDLYARENLKNRPAWAPDQSVYKDRIRAFYQQEEKERRFLPAYAGYDWKQLRSMTHLEILPDRAVLFDYKERDPIDGSARQAEIPEWI